MYYTMNVIFPSLLIAISHLCGFFFEPERIERVQMSLTCLLAYMVFQIIILGDVPKSSDHIPLLTFYINVQMAYITKSLLIEGFAAWLVAQSKRGHRPPRLVFAIAYVLSKLLLVRRRVNQQLPLNHLIEYSLTGLIVRPPAVPVSNGGNTQNDDNGEHEGNHQSSSKGCSCSGGLWQRIMVSYDKHEKNDASGDSNNNEPAKLWHFVADVVDRINVVLYILEVIFTPMAIFYLLPRLLNIA